MFDVWFDGESVEPVLMQQLETKLQEALTCQPLKLLCWSTASLIVSSAVAVLMKCRNYRTNLPRGAQKCASRRIEHAAESSALDEVPSPNIASSTSSVTLAAVGETIPTQPRDMTPPSVSTDHLQLVDC